MSKSKAPAWLYKLTIIELLAIHMIYIPQLFMQYFGDIGIVIYAGIYLLILFCATLSICVAHKQRTGYHHRMLR